MNQSATSTGVTSSNAAGAKRTQRWTPSEYRILCDKLHGTDISGEALLQKLQKHSSDANKDDKTKCHLSFDEWTEKHGGHPTQSASPLLYNEVNRNLMLDIFRIRSDRDEPWTTEEGNHLMRKWFGPELLWTDGERAIFTEDESWNTADDFVTDEEQDQLRDELLPYNDEPDRGERAASRSGKPEEEDSEDTVSAGSEEEIDVVSVARATKKLMGMTAYEAHVETFMAMDAKEMQKLMLHKMNEDEEIQNVFMHQSNGASRL